MYIYRPTVYIVCVRCQKLVEICQITSHVEKCRSCGHLQDVELVKIGQNASSRQKQPKLQRQKWSECVRKRHMSKGVNEFDHFLTIKKMSVDHP